MNESILNTGAVVIGRKEFEMVNDPDWYAYNYEYQVPIIIFTEKIPEKRPKETDKISFNLPLVEWMNLMN